MSARPDPVGAVPEVVELAVVDGALASEQWVYAVLGTDGSVLHVGCTALPLAARAWLHLTSDDPEVGRLRAHVAPADLARATVLGVRVPAGVDRAVVRDEARRLLDWHELTRTEPAACEIAPAPGAVGALASALVEAVRRRS